MTATDKTIATILATLGFETADAPEFVEDVARLVEAGDREGLIARIAGGAPYGYASETADEILRLARGEEPLLNEYHVFDREPAVGGEPWRDGPYFFRTIDEAEEYVRGVLDRATVLECYGGHAIVTIRGREDGIWTEESVEVEVVAHDLRDHVLVETIPASDRSSHEAAGSAGVWPHNGARRVLMHRADAEEWIESDGGWSRIVRAARPEDDGAYDVIFDVSVFTP